MNPIEFTFKDDYPISEPGWVYVWMVQGVILYIGATWIHPAVRAELHLKADTDDDRSLAIRDALRYRNTEPVVVAFPVGPGEDRQRYKYELIIQCRNRGWLAQDFVQPGALIPAVSDVPSIWVAEAVKHLNRRLRH